MNDPYYTYEEWGRRMNLAADCAPCECPEKPESNSSDCPCPACTLSYWWDTLGGLERGLLFAGMARQRLLLEGYPGK